MKHLALALAALIAAGPALARDCYREANAAYSAGDFGVAGASFAANAEHPECATSRDRLLISAGEAYRRQGEKTGDTEWWCKASEAYQRAVEAADRPRLVTAAREGAEATTPHCTPVAPVPRPAAAPIDPLTAGSTVERAPPMVMAPKPPTEADEEGSDATTWIIVGGAVVVAAVGIGAAVLFLGSDEEAEPVSSLGFSGDGE